MPEYNIDLPLVVLPVVKLLHKVFHVPDHPMLKKVTPLSLNFFLLFVVVLVGLPLPLTVVVEPIRLCFGEFRYSGSGLLTVTLSLASFVFPTSIFWYTTLICICIAPWSDMLCNMLHSSLPAVPRPTLLTTTQTQEEEEEITTIAPHQPGLQRPMASSSSLPPKFEFDELNEIVIDDVENL